MNTPAHLILGAAAFARPSSSRNYACAFAGGLAPDLSLYVMVAAAINVYGIAPERVFNELYFSREWMAVFAVDNSFLLWGAALTVAYWRGWVGTQIFCLSALLHIALDFPLHHDDGRPHFWPLTMWIFESPVSYWDRAQGAAWVGPLEVALVTLAAILIWLRRPPVWVAVLTGVLLLPELWIVRQWLFFFGA